MALLAATAIVAALTAVSGASAAATVCDTAHPITSGTHQGVIVPAGETCVIQAVNGAFIEVAGSISVGQGAVLNMQATTGALIEVTGSISVGQGASLRVVAGNPLSCGQILIHGSVAATNPLSISFAAFRSACTLRVDGSISVRGASQDVSLFRISVGGSVALTDSPAATSVSIRVSTIGGSVTVRNNNVASDVFLADNSIGGSVNFSNNIAAGSPGIIFVAFNTIGGSLACSGNSGQSETFGPNTVGGSKSGQCATL